MNKVYNTQSDISSKIFNFLSNNTPSLHKPQLKFIPSVIFGMIMSESIVSSDIARELKEEFSLVQLDSITRRLRRLLNNPRFDGYLFYHQIISSIINNYKVKHSSNKLHITIDHMYSKENYTILFVSMRIGKQGIPIYFECFKGIRNPDAFYDSTIIKAIDYTYNLLKDKGFDIIFLADRWFNSQTILKHIDNLGCTYCIRLKSNLKISVFDKKEGHYIRKYSGDLTSQIYHSIYYNDVYIYDDLLYKTSITIGRKCVSEEPWIIATNGNPKEAIRNYTHRFDSVECVFKNQKSNGFYLEDITTVSIRAFINLYSLLCFATLFLTILGADYTKNKKCYKNVKITTHKYYKTKGKVRVMSLFNVGLTLFKLAVNSLRYIRIPFHMILYDI